MNTGLLTILAAASPQTRGFHRPQNSNLRLYIYTKLRRTKLTEQKIQSASVLFQNQQKAEPEADTLSVKVNRSIHTQTC